MNVVEKSYVLLKIMGIVFLVPIVLSAYRVLQMYYSFAYYTLIYIMVYSIICISLYKSKIEYNHEFMLYTRYIFLYPIRRKICYKDLKKVRANLLFGIVKEVLIITKDNKYIRIPGIEYDNKSLLGLIDYLEMNTK